MLKINLMEDEDLSIVVNGFISALLPHENYDFSMFANVLNTLFKYIKFEEFKLEYRLLLEALVDLNRIHLSIPEFVPQLDKSTFEHILAASIVSAITNPELGVHDWLVFEGLNTDLRIQTNREEVCQRLCVRALDLYDTCFEEAQSTVTVLNREPELRAAFLKHVSTQCINTQAEVLQDVRIKYGKPGESVDKWLKYTMQSVAEINSRLNEAENSKTLSLDTIEGSYKLLSEVATLMVPITKWGIPPIDEYTPILRHRLVVVVGQENIGKTKFAVDKAVNVLLEGKKVVYMCGETSQAKVYADILINYIWKKFGYHVTSEHLACPEVCCDEVRVAIGIAIDEVTNKAGLILAESFNYATLYSELTTLYERYSFDMVVIDHSCTLVGTAGDGSLKAKIDKLAEDCRNFKKAFPVCILVTSHPSVAGKETAKRDKNANDSVTKGSQNLSGEADEVFYLRTNETLDKQDLLILENVKRRDAGKTENIILRKQFDVSALVYDVGLQSDESKLSIDREQGLAMLDDMLGTNESEDDVYSIGG